MASTSRSAQPRSMASLGGLPPELKAQIVQELYYILIVDAAIDSPLFVEDDPNPTSPTKSGPESTARTGSLTDENRQPQATTASNEDDGWEDEDDDEEDESRSNSDLDEFRETRFPSMKELMKTRQELLDAASGDFKSLHDLALVNREFAELSFPWIWRELDLEERTAEAVITLVKEILPRHGRHVRYLAFGQADSELYDYERNFELKTRPGDKVNQIIKEAEELFGIKDAQQDSKGSRVRRARGLLIAKLIQMCPNIEIVDCEAFQKNPIPDDAYEDDPAVIDMGSAYMTDHALDAIRIHLGPKLTDLTLLMNDDGLSTEGDVAQLLEGCPNLLRVDLEVYCAFKEPEERTALHEALIKLHKVETLDIGAGFFVTDEFVRLVLEYEQEEEEGQGLVPSNPFPALECLALVECMDLSFESFYNLVQRFSRTLRILDLDSTPHANHPAMTKKYLGKPFDLPRLETLVLSTPHEPKFLDSFVNCKLVEFSLGFCPAFAYKDVEDFITLHQETLKKLEIADDAALTQAQVESLEVFCHAKGIRCELLEPDSDSDDDSDDGLMNPSDFDDDDEGGWFDEQSEEEDDHVDGHFY